MGCCCFKSLRRKAKVRPSTSFWEQTLDTEQGMSTSGATKEKRMTGTFTSSTENIEFFYEFTRTLGQNKFGTVKEAYRKNDISKKRFAVKIMPRYQHEQNTRREIQNLLKLDHPGICKFYETYIDNENVYLVMEYCEGGSLSTQPLHSRGEAFIAKVIYDLITAVHHMHSMKIIHRNLNLKNVLFTDGSQSQVKIINLGYSRNLADEPLTQQVILSNANWRKSSAMLQRSFTKHVGTDFFAAPEVMVTSTYGSECDVWSLGVISYCLLSGEVPFASTEEALKTEVSFKSAAWRSVSKQAMIAIAKMLQPLPKKRITLAKLLKEEWFKLMASNKLSGQVIAYDLERLLVEEKIRNYGNANQFKQMCIRLLVKNAKATDLSAARFIFEQLDQDKNGFLEKDELRALIDENTSFSEESKRNVKLILQLFFKSNSEQHATVKYTDFLAATLSDAYFEEKSLKELFGILDTSKNGYLDFHDLVDLMAREGMKIDEDQAKVILDDYACFLKGGKLFMEDFYRLMVEDRTRVKERIRIGRDPNGISPPLKAIKRDSRRLDSSSITNNIESSQLIKMDQSLDSQQNPGRTKRASQQLIQVSNFGNGVKIQQRQSVQLASYFSAGSSGSPVIRKPQSEAMIPIEENNGIGFGESAKHRKSKFLIEDQMPMSTPKFR